MPQKGDVVLYVCEFDADTTQSPNIWPAIVAKVTSPGVLDLVVQTMNGVFFKSNVPQSDPGSVTRMTWIPKQ